MDYPIENGVASLSYMSSNSHHFLGDEKLQQTIGIDGCNLSIVILSLNRFHLTQTLLTSIEQYMPNFKGDIIIMDNGSTTDTLSLLEDFLKHYTLSYKLIPLSTNYGVSKGRNKSLDYVQTDWIMFLDNDIYFLDNPLPSIHQALNQLGCHFLNLPLLSSNQKSLYALGGHLTMSSNTPSTHVECGSVYSTSSPLHTTKISPFLSTFLFGGASVLKKSTFIQLGAFDENMFLGYEDIDFSIRLYNAGIKIGNCGQICLVHNHIIDSSNDIQSYESIRSSYEILTQSAIYIENKYSITVRPERFENSSSDLRTINTPITIALVVDGSEDPNFNLAQQLKYALADLFHIDIILISSFNNISEFLFHTQSFQLIHFFEYDSLSNFFAPDKRILPLCVGINTIQYTQLMNHLTLSIGITHSTTTLTDIRKNNSSILNYISYYYVTSDTSNFNYSNMLHPLKSPYILFDIQDIDALKHYFMSIFDMI